jgi:hypothetical protein
MPTPYRAGGRPAWRAAGVALVATAALSAFAAPIPIEPEKATLTDPAEMAMRRTVAGTAALAPSRPLSASALPTAPSPAHSADAATPMPAAAPDPVAYALLGLGLLGAGLLARRSAGRQRGFSKKT